MDNLLYCEICGTNGCGLHVKIGGAPKNDHGCGGSFLLVRPNGKRTGVVESARACSVCIGTEYAYEGFIGREVLLPDSFEGSWEEAGECHPLQSFSQAWETTLKEGNLVLAGNLGLAELEARGLVRPPLREKRPLVRPPQFPGKSLLSEYLDKVRGSGKEDK